MPNQPNRDYWAKRQEALTEQILNKGEEYNARLVTEFERAIGSMQDQIEVFYGRYAENNEMSLTDARKRLNARQTKDFKMGVADYIKKGRTLDYSDKHAKLLENASIAYRVTRLQAMQLQMHQTAEEIMVLYYSTLKDHLKSSYENAYYLQLYTLSKGMNAAIRFDRVDPNYVEKILVRPWAADGVNFSQRIWGDRDTLINQLDATLMQGLIRGDSKRSVIEDLSKRMDVSRSHAGRLVMTETAYFASAATNDAYKEFGVEKFEFLATLDNRTSLICQSMDGKIIKRSDYKAGVNAPPLHVRCRSTTLPVIEDQDGWIEERAARDENGKYIRVPASTTYDEWFNEYAN